MTSSSSSADIFNRLQLFRGAGNEGDHDFDPDRPPRPNPAASRVKRCLFGRGNHEENIKFAKRELEKSRTESKNKWENIYFIFNLNYLISKNLTFSFCVLNYILFL